MNRVDIAIVGTGPAGLSAAINAKIRNKSFLLFGTKALSSKIGCSKCIDNYPGILSISGEKLNECFTKHLQHMEIPITQERITGIYNMGSYFMLLADQKEFEASTVILAIGSETVREVPGERELLGRGVSYCATCDGNLYKGKNIAVVCDSRELEEEVVYLAQLAGRVYYFPLFKSSLTGDNIIRPAGAIKEVQGNGHVECVRLSGNETLHVDGVFFIKQAVSADVLLQGLIMENGHIVVDRNMSTNIRGCFAAGDCTGRPYQIAKAIGEGNITLHSAVSYMSGK